ncbi:MAG: hypothetical protein K8F91_22670, partial [Candidatus Obscuribacterales bacterium]|nr:hypothetical protein [Candidatus Obscuribacterales bacterium]
TGGDRDCFSLIEGDIEILTSVKYVITLDTDTQLPRDAARQFVETMDHPLNRACYDKRKKRVTGGYGILQPRVGVSLPGTNRSRYAALNGNEPGIDPYTRTVSDVYQDLFQEGSFIGKGIYEVEQFEAVLKGRFPENRILSHDLLEGCYARSGLLSDVELYEEYPTGYSADVSRRHRWIRGDWQLLNWLLPRVPIFNNKTENNPLSLLSRWKIFDNLRRSLEPLSLLLFFLLGWALLSPVWLWTLLGLSVFFLPPIAFSFVEILKKPDDVHFKQHLRAKTGPAFRQLVQSCFSLACLPYEAFFSMDAILGTLGKMIFTHKKLLAWNPSSVSNQSNSSTLKRYCFLMASAPLIGVLTFSSLLLYRPESLVYAWPVLLAWFLSPAIAWWISLPIARSQAQITDEQRYFLGKIARKTWAFFETFVCAEEHWLPPDNYQEMPLVGVAHRTSPTNMGLSLLANLTAYDFGYIQSGELIERTRNTLATMQRLERHRGHLYNWYDTVTLKPLPPRYISTVDSGNLAGHLLTLNPGLLALPDQSIVRLKTFDGLEDTLSVLIDNWQTSDMPALKDFVDELKACRESSPSKLVDMKECLERLVERSLYLVGRFDDTAGDEASLWVDALARQCSDALTELGLLAPWAFLPPLSDPFPELLSIDRIPTLQEVASIYQDFEPFIKQRQEKVVGTEEHEQLARLLESMSGAVRSARQRLSAIEKLVQQGSELADFEYDFLFDKSRRLLSIGYNADQRRLDSGFYDLLASEARLCNFVAIAQGRLPQESWFSLGRLLTSASGESVLFSWSGSMFEYLMPLLVMP